MGKKRPKSRAVKQLPPATIDKTSNESIANEVIAAASSTVNQQNALMRVCRLCETKDGPFLMIFDADNMTVKKIQEVMPFRIAEHDDLPHNICFRCSAKVEELFEFIQKCTKTQHSLHTAMGKKDPVVTKAKIRLLWEKKVNKTNLTNEEICNTLVKNAMEGFKYTINPILSLEEDKLQQPSSSKNTKAIIETPVTSKTDKEPIEISSKNNIVYQSDDEPDRVNLNKQVKSAIDKCDDKVPLSRSSRSKKCDDLLEGWVEPPKKLGTRKSQNKHEPAPVVTKSTNDVKQSEDQNMSPVVIDDRNKDKPDKVKEKRLDEPVHVEETPAPIKIMDHVSIIKVNGVGTLYLCKLCNRNFLKKDVVMSHGCAKNNVPKDSFLQNHVPRPEVSKPPTVKYIKIDKDFKKSVVTETKPVEKNPSLSECIRVNIPVQPEIRYRPRAGPASKVKQLRLVSEEPSLPPTTTSKEAPAVDKPNISQADIPLVPSVQFPTIPSLNSRYKLVPGPNNSFTLVEDCDQKNEKPVNESIFGQTKTMKRRTIANNVEKHEDAPMKHVEEVIDLDDIVPSPPQPVTQLYPVGKPYPVGLFQTVPHHSGVFPSNTHPQPPAFTTPAMKKQSYTIVQTGNPSKLLISTKPQPIPQEASRKRARKTKPEVREICNKSYNVAEVGDTPKDGFFTFINVDPQSQPSYVLPTDNIIQESQISTSTPVSKTFLDKDKDKYGCNMCGDKFSREKKLLAHIQSHYNQMDEEDELRAEKTSHKRKARKL